MRHGDDLVKPGDIIYIHLADAVEGSAHRATLEKDSGAQASLMAMDNTTGDVLAMVGGRDYALSEFNRATQAERQTGSSFKPYVYTAAIEDGAKPTDIIVDGPVSFGGYTPHNYENDYKGPMTLVNAFAESRNIPALKLAARVGIHNVIDMTHRFGVTSNIPAYLPVAIGAVEITLQEQVASYAVFPNDGLRVTPRLIRKVSNADGITLWEDNPEVTEVIDQQTARTMMTLLQAVTDYGTGAAARQLNHPLGGKTGTTSDYTDAWFLGFSPSVTCGVWVGYDDRQSLGEKETGAKAALPIWMAVMQPGHRRQRRRAVPQRSENRTGPAVTASAAGIRAFIRRPRHRIRRIRRRSQAQTLVQAVSLRAGIRLPGKTLNHAAIKPATKQTVAANSPRPLVKPQVKSASLPQAVAIKPQGGIVKPALAPATP